MRISIPILSYIALAVGAKSKGLPESCLRPVHFLARAGSSANSCCSNSLRFGQPAENKETYLEKDFCREGVGQCDQQVVRVGFLPKLQGFRICAFITLQCCDLDEIEPSFTSAISHITYPHEPFTTMFISTLV